MTKRRTKMIQISIRIPNTYIADMNVLIKRGQYRLVSDIIRCAIAKMLYKYKRISIKYVRRMCKNVNLTPTKYTKQSCNVEIRGTAPESVPENLRMYIVDVGEYYGVPLDVLKKYGEPVEVCYDLGGWLLYYVNNRFCAFSKNSE